MIITKEEERMAFVYSLANKHVTSTFLCKRCTFTSCHSVCVRSHRNITDNPSNVGKQSVFSCIYLLVTARQLHKDKPGENFSKVHFKSRAVNGLPA